MSTVRPALIAVLGVLVLLLGACAGSDDAANGETEPAAAADAADGTSEDGDAATAVDEEPSGEPVSVVVTTAILGDIVTQVLDGTDAEVEVLMPSGVDPHAYEPSASDGLVLREADLVVANGLGLEEALLDVIASAEEDGVQVVAVAEQLDGLLEPGESGDDHSHDHGDDAHDHGEEETTGEDAHDGEGEKDAGGDDDHDHGDFDPHVWLDPRNVGEMAEVVAAAYADVVPGAEETVAANAAAVVAAMTEMDAELQDLVATLDDDQRQLVTNHGALGYLAAHYDLEIIATVLPGTSTDVDVTAAGFTELVGTIREAGVPAIFADSSASDRLAQSLAEEIGDVEVVELYSESLGPPGSGAETVAGMIRTNIERIVAALG